MIDLEIPMVDKRLVDKYDYTCRKCKFKFRINLEKGFPSRCPWCSTDVDFKSF